MTSKECASSSTTLLSLSTLFLIQLSFLSEAFKLNNNAVCSRSSFILKCDDSDPNNRNLYETLVLSTRGGASVKDDAEESDDEYESEDEDEEYEDSDDEYESEEDYEEDKDEDDEASVTPSSSSIDKGPCDTLLPLPPFQQMGLTLGIMCFSKKLDFADKKVIKWCRICFLSCMVLTQTFLACVRIRAYQMNDTTTINQQEVNPLLSALLPSSTPDIAKQLASKMLASSTPQSIMDYDISQAKVFNNRLFFPTAFLFFLHFKMGQVQPLLCQSASGILNLIYSPLWQAYVLGRNLERPFKIPSPLSNLAQTADHDDKDDEDTTSIVDDEETSEQDDDNDEDDEEEEDSDEYDDED